MVSVVLAITYEYLVTTNSMKNDDRISHTNGISHKNSWCVCKETGDIGENLSSEHKNKELNKHS